MKETKVTISGFSDDTSPDDKPAVCVYGLENTGKSRFACTAPCSEGMLGYIALDKNAKRTVDKYKQEHGLRVLVNTKPFMDDKDSIALARLDCANEKDRAVVKSKYSDAVNRVFDAGMALAGDSRIESIVLDTGSQFFDWILFSHFGRRNQIESYQRGAPNQDLIDFVVAMRAKNFVMVQRSAEIWKDSGEVDRDGKKKQSPSGRMKPDGFGKIGYYMTAVLELSAASAGEKSKDLDSKYRVKVVTSKGNTLFEGMDLADTEWEIKGEGICWDNVMMALGLGQ